MAKKALIVIAEGFEEIEAATPIDVLRRAGVEVITAGLVSNSVTGAHGVTLNTDTVLEDYKGLPDALVLPGGMPGAENLAGSLELKDLIQHVNAKGNIVAAICASPALVLSPTGLLDGRSATCYPGMEGNFTAQVKAVEDKVVQDGNIITSRGPGTALNFSLKIAENLAGKEQAAAVADQTLFA